MSYLLEMSSRIKIKRTIKNLINQTIFKEIPRIYMNKRKHFLNFPANFPQSTVTKTKNLSTHKVFNKTMTKSLVNMKLKKNRFFQPITSVWALTIHIWLFPTITISTRPIFLPEIHCKPKNQFLWKITMITVCLISSLRKITKDKATKTYPKNTKSSKNILCFTMAKTLIKAVRKWVQYHQKESSGSRITRRKFVKRAMKNHQKRNSNFLNQWSILPMIWILWTTLAPALAHKK